MNSTSHLYGSGCIHKPGNLLYKTGIKVFNHDTFNKTNLRNSIPSQICKDDNQRILNLLIERMEIGINRYGQGVRKDDDTRKFGCEDDSWLEMELQEVLDGMIYTATSILRLRDKLRVKQLRL